MNDTPGRLLPGVKIEPYYDRSELIGVTTETVRENLVVGMVLVTVILLMFLSNVRTRADRGHQHSAGAAVRLRRAVSCAASRPTCCRSAPSISASSSIRR